ncbi:MAG: WhiB family transcriptional regulator, redox-sensing transcriptional regulator [Actinomycetota bacterium]|nr:WhiB family transcriptional regulator, redox-sensing transcriptional regulator [Actinomycetota bacterium]
MVPVSEVSRLPVVVSENWDWQMRGACRGMDAAVFFHSDNERGMARKRREELAKQICASCPVRLQCLDHAVAVRETHGIWGGLGEGELRQLIATQV